MGQNSTPGGGDDDGDDGDDDDAKLLVSKMRHLSKRAVTERDGH